MKAIIIDYKGQIELTLETGTVYVPNEGETKKAFLKRISDFVQDEAMENLDLTAVSEASLKKMSNKALLEAVESGIENLHRSAVVEVLGSRGVDVDGEEGAVPTTETKKETKPAKAAKATKADDAEAKAAKKEAAEKAKAAKKEAAEKAKAAKKEAAEKARAAREASKLTDEQVAELVEGAKEYVGKVLEFIPFGADKTPVLGEVTFISVDKRVNKVYFRMRRLDDGKTIHKSVQSGEVSLDEKETAILKAARENEAAEKAANAALEKAAKAKEKAAAKEKAKAEADTKNYMKVDAAYAKAAQKEKADAKAAKKAK